MKMKKNGVSRLLALVAVCLVLVGVGMIVHREGELAQWQKARALVLEEVVLEGEMPRYALVLGFTDRQGARHRFRSPFKNESSAERVGEEVSIYFNPDSPESLVVDSVRGKHLTALVALAIGVMLVLLSLLVRRSDAEEPDTDT